ncbi:hypothetical protein ACS3UN_11375 [Oscillospiraceae bacterium LTW-04]|nr:hypothetical protein RBH76_13120 [Oscillospiraceae bacterium MB24-C1]
MTRKRKKKRFTSFLIIITGILFLLTAVGNPVVLYNNHRLKRALTSLDAQTVTLNEVVPFRWDVVYTFDAYLSKGEMEKIIGFKSANLQEMVNSGMVQLVFVKGRSVVGSVCSYADVLGYYIQFEPGEGYYSKVEFNDHADFDIEKRDGIIRLYYADAPAY